VAQEPIDALVRPPIVVRFSRDLFPLVDAAGKKTRLYLNPIKTAPEPR
jgi:hypothetical protein